MERSDNSNPGNTPIDYKKKYRTLKKKVERERSSERYISTWFQVTSTNLYSRRQVIDTKAGLMITVNSIIISILIGSLYPKLLENPQLLWGLGPMVIANVVSIIFAVLATRPIIAKPSATTEDMQAGNRSLNTFDDYYKMSETEYLSAVHQMISNAAYIHNSYLKENYRVGRDLARRYGRMRKSYNAFLAGIIASSFGFGICQFILF